MKSERNDQSDTKKYVIGIDFGTDSVRSVLLDHTGQQQAEAVSYYSRWQQGMYCNPGANQFRHHPLDYVEGLETTIKQVVAEVEQKVVDNIQGISVDTTGSTPAAVNRNGKPLALCSGFEENPNAMFILWKDHTAVREAQEITTKAKTWGGADYTKYIGGIYSSEWFWAKMLHTIREDPDIRDAAYSWVELCDWVPFLLTGGQDVTKMKRSRCAAGHKAMWHNEFDGLPSQNYLNAIDPLLNGMRKRLYQKTFTADEAAGKISDRWAKKLGLPSDVVIGIGAFDAHMGAVGGEIEPYYLSRVMGTSTCDILVAPAEKLNDTRVKGICGQVDGSVIPGMIGLEAGQSSFGDVYAWFKDVLLWPFKQIINQNETLTDAQKEQLINQATSQTIPLLAKKASTLEPREFDPIALDWLNGRRTPDANQRLKAAIEGLELSSSAPKIFKSLVEATCFGAKAIVERFRNEGVPIKGVIGLGGVANKSPYIMQTLANVLNMPIKIAQSSHACAHGAAMFAATASGIFEDVEDAKKAMGSGFSDIYNPDPKRVNVYQKMYQRYTSLGAIVEKRTANQQITDN